MVVTSENQRQGKAVTVSGKKKGAQLKAEVRKEMQTVMGIEC
jgi:hypothetical protein